MSPRTTIPPYAVEGGPTWRLDLGDCLDVLRSLPAASVDALVTDPPAGIGFMGKEWDTFGRSNPNAERDRAAAAGLNGKSSQPFAYSGSSRSPGDRERFIAFLADRFTEARRVLKPGAHALVWAIPRTSHWTATALEDAGFEIRDVLTHHFGTGFPKSLDVSKAIDAATPDAERWSGWGTALKPASEHWILARVPLSGTVAANVLAYGTGGLNIDATRIGSDVRTYRGMSNNGKGVGVFRDDNWQARDDVEITVAGRWPTNVVFTHAPDCGDVCAEGCPVAQLDAQAPELSPGNHPANRSGLGYGSTSQGTKTERVATDEGSASRFYPVFRWYDADFLYTPKPATSERDQGLEGYSMKTPGELTDREDGSAGISARAGARGRRRNFHPTVKPIDLMRWLCRLITPPGGTVIDPFAGSGTTIAAALREGFHAIGAEQDPDYYALAESRIIGDAPLWNLGARILKP